MILSLPFYCSKKAAFSADLLITSSIDTFSRHVIGRLHTRADRMNMCEPGCSLIQQPDVFLFQTLACRCVDLMIPPLALSCKGFSSVMNGRWFQGDESK